LEPKFDAVELVPNHPLEQWPTTKLGEEGGRDLTLQWLGTSDLQITSLIFVM
jgi:hypothetical protein